MKEPRSVAISRRRFLLGSLGGGAALLAGMLACALRRKLRGRLDQWTRLRSFSSPPPLVPHDPATERRTIAVARGGTPANNVDTALDRAGGIAKYVGTDDLVIIKVSAQWWKQGMTNVAATRRVVEQVLARPGFRGELVVFEHTHFRLANGSGLARDFTRPSERNVDVPGWNKLGDLVPHFTKPGIRVGFVGLVDGGKSALAEDDWHDPGHAHGIYGGDGRGPIADGDPRDGYSWDEEHAFRLQRSRVQWAQTPLTWPRFTSPVSGEVIDLKDGILRRDGGRFTPTGRKLTWISLVTANEHVMTGLTCCCKSAMGIVDMSAGRLGTYPSMVDYQSVQYFGCPHATWRMAGPLAQFAREVRAPDLCLAVAEWVGVAPKEGAWDDDVNDLRLEARAAHRANTVVAGTDPVAIHAWCARHILHPLGGRNAHHLDLDDPASRLSCFLRYYREVYRSGTLDEELVTVV